METATWNFCLGLVNKKDTVRVSSSRVKENIVLKFIRKIQRESAVAEPTENIVHIIRKKSERVSCF